MAKNKEEVSLGYLFVTFFKIGLTSFGGFMALISVVQNQLVTKDKVIEDEAILDGISLVSILPGPVAVNFVTYIGFTFKGIKGALVSMLGVILPSFLLMLVLAYIYFTYSNLFYFNHFFNGVVPAVAAIILVVAINMAKKHIRSFKQLPVAIIAALAVYYFKGFYTTFTVIAVAGLIGALFYNKASSSFFSTSKKGFNLLSFLRKMIGLLLAKKYKILVFVFIMLLVFTIQLFFKDLASPYFKQLGQILLTFSSISVFLFGGGYVFIPTIQDMVVNQLGWLSLTEFIDAIALGQITPGPILISATFIGYKVSGLSGALVATMAIFMPPALLTVLLSKFYLLVRTQFLVVEAIIKGIRPAVIGMIFTAVPIILSSMEFSLISISIFLTTAILTFQFKVNAIVLIPAAGIIGMMVM